MKFFLDQDIYDSTARLLKSLNHDIVTASDMGYASKEDLELLKVAQRLKRILITRDRDFGGLVFVRKIITGVIYLRMLPSVLNSVHNELETVLKTYSEEDLCRSFVVVEPGKHRIRRFLDYNGKIER